MKAILVHKCAVPSCTREADWQVFKNRKWVWVCTPHIPERAEKILPPSKLRMISKLISNLWRLK